MLIVQVKVWEVFEQGRFASKRSIRRIPEEDSVPDLNHHLTQENFKIGVCKTRQVQELIGESPTRSAFATLIAVWNPKITGGPAKLDEISAHSVCRRVVQRAKLMSSNGRELDGF